MWFLNLMKKVFNMFFYGSLGLVLAIFFLIDFMLYSFLLLMYFYLMIKNYSLMNDNHKYFLKLVYRGFVKKETEIFVDEGENYCSMNKLNDYFKLKVTYVDKGFFEIIETVLLNQKTYVIKNPKDQQSFDFYVTLPFILFFSHLKFGKKRLTLKVKGLSTYAQYSCSVIVKDETKTLNELLNEMKKTEYLMGSL